MLTAPLSPALSDEEQRLVTLADYGLVDTPPEDDFDRLVKLASRLFEVEIALISLVGRDRQFFKARVGLDVCGTSRDVSFCAHAISQDDILFVPDASRDPRFSANPLVTGPPFIRFYAGKPLIVPTGERIGTLCLIDSKPRATFTEQNRCNLTDLAFLVLDRMELRRLDHAKIVNQQRFENIAAASPDAIICSSPERLITFWNRSAEKLFGFSATEVVGRSSDIILSERSRTSYAVELRQVLNGRAVELADRTVELFGRRSNGSEFPAVFAFSTWVEGRTTSIGIIVRDISERHQNEASLYRLAWTDALTQLPNLAMWRACLGKTLAAEMPAILLLLDLDGFKEVNDTLGHSAGDTVLKEVAKRLERTCPAAILTARLGGDEFAVLMAGNDVDEANTIARRLVGAIQKPYWIDRKQMEIGVSIGVAMAPVHSSKPEDLFSAADLALYKAKAGGRGRYEFFSPIMRELAIARRALQRELRLAFEQDEFELFYQPQFNTHTGKLTGAEALMRWRHPQRGLLTPAAFMDVLSEKPIAPAVGEWALRTACRNAAEWRCQVPGFRIGVNLFEAQLRSEYLVATVRDVLQETGLPAEALELEIVENIVLRNESHLLTALHDLRRLGVGLAFDDYGTGFASLSLLKRYPVSRLKIDRSFVSDVHSDPADAAVVRAVIYLGKSFGLEVIAEGVETETQLDFLAANDCGEVQGYLFGKPVPADEFAAKFLFMELI